MKKVAAIALLLLLTFQWVGCRFLYQWEVQRWADRVNAELDNGAETLYQTFELRLPLDMPYGRSNTDWERHEGVISSEGKQYRYVKRKMEGGTLVLQCIRDTKTEKIGAAFAKLDGGEVTEDSGDKGGDVSISKAKWTDVLISQIEWHEILQSKELHLFFTNHDPGTVDGFSGFMPRPPRMG